jgi:hypothetical protein
MSERKEISAEEALILITCASAAPDILRDFMRRAKIRRAGRATFTDAILANYRTRRGYDLARFAADFGSIAPNTEMAA